MRFGGNFTRIYFVSATTYSIDALVSRDFYVIDPYVGMGLQMWSGGLDTVPGISQLPVSVASTASGTDPRVFVGAALKLVFLKLTPQYSYSFAKISTYGLKLSLNF